MAGKRLVRVKLQVKVPSITLVTLRTLLFEFYAKKKKRTDPLDPAAIGTDRFTLLILSFECVPVKLKKLGWNASLSLLR